MKFWKMSGGGNDFILLHDPGLTDLRLESLAKLLCRRRLSIGADGLLAVRKEGRGGIAVKYFNPDGTEAFCGNGSRCAVWWAYQHKLCQKKLLLHALPGQFEAEIISHGTVRTAMPDVEKIERYKTMLLSKKNIEAFYMNTGVPHCIADIPADTFEDFDVFSEGRALRYSPLFKSGANINFISRTCAAAGDNILKVRTYERGVEDETLACGTGITASAIAAGLIYNMHSPITVQARSGAVFKVWYEAKGGRTINIFVQGPAELVFEGEVNV